MIELLIFYTLFTMGLRSLFGGLRKSMANSFEQTARQIVPFQYIYTCRYGDSCFAEAIKGTNT